MSMNSERNITDLRITKLPDGGFIVSGSGDDKVYCAPRFACTSIDDALAYCRDKLSESSERSPGSELEGR